MGKIFFSPRGPWWTHRWPPPCAMYAMCGYQFGRSTIDGHAKQKRAHHWKSIGAFRYDTLGENVTGNLRVFSPNTYAHLSL